MDNDILDDDLALDNFRETNFKFAGFWIRVGASLIDWLILMPVLLLGIYNGLSYKSMSLMILLSLITSAYKPYLEWSRSATYGKSIVNIKLMNKDSSKISGQESILRNIPWIISYMLALGSNVYLYSLPEFQDVSQFLELGALGQGSLINKLNTYFGFVILFIAISIAIDSKKQGFHDKLAGTYCVFSK